MISIITRAAIRRAPIICRFNTVHGGNKGMSTSAIQPKDLVVQPQPFVAEPLAEPKQSFSAPIPGFAEYSPQEQYAFNRWLQTVKETYAEHGFSYLHTRPFERKGALWGEGETQKQVFGVTRLNADEPDTGLAIPYDRTVPFALWVAEHGPDITFPYKRQDVGLSFRGEAPRPGRFRAFIQADVDVAGKALGLNADAECLATLITTLKRLDLGIPFTFSVNHILIVRSMVKTFGVADVHQPEVLRLIDKLDKMSQEDVVASICDIPNLNVEKKVVEKMVSNFAQRAKVEDFIFDQDYGADAKKGLEDLTIVIQLLNNLGVDTSCVLFSPGMVRGLAYYTGLVFEAVLDGKESYGSISGGGRYDNLVGSFNPKYADIGGVGGTIGLTRLFDIMVREKMRLPKRSTIANVVVGYRTKEQLAFASNVVAALRLRGVPTDFYCGTEKVKSFYTYANKIGVPVTVIAMDAQSFVVKDMLRSDVDRTYKGVDCASPEEAVEQAFTMLSKV